MNQKNYYFLILSILGATLVNGLPNFQSVAHAGIIGNGDYSNQLDKLTYEAFASQSKFGNTGKMLLKGSENSKGASCTGNLIAPNWVLTSGHCLYDQNRKSTNLIGKIDFEFPGSTGTQVGHAVDAVVYKHWQTAVDFNLDNDTKASVDLALIRLDKKINSNAPLLIPSAEAITTQFTASFAGYGMQGDGNTGAISGTTHTTLLGGENIAKVLGNGVFTYDLDKGGNSVYNIDFLPSVALEYMPANGDSGAPVFSGNKFVGLHSRSKGGQRCFPISGNCFNHEKSKWGTIGSATPLSPYVGWIANVLDQFNDSSTATKYTSQGKKVKFASFNENFPNWDAGDVIEVDDSEFLYEFDLTPDTFSDEFNQEIYDRVFANDNNGGGNSGGDPTQVPEADNVFGLSIISFLMLLSKLHKKQN